MLSECKLIKKLVSIVLISVIFTNLVSATNPEFQRIKNKSVLYTATSGGSPYIQNTWTRDPIEVYLQSDKTDVSSFQYADAGTYKHKDVLNKYQANTIYSVSDLEYPNVNAPTSNVPDDIFNKMRAMDRGTLVFDFYNSVRNGVGYGTMFTLGDNRTDQNHFGISVGDPPNAVISVHPILSQPNLILDAYFETKINKLDSIAIQSSPDFGHKIFINGRLAGSSNAQQYYYFHNIPNANYARIGNIDRSGPASSNDVPMTGGILKASIYDTVIPDQDLIQATKDNESSWSNVDKNNKVSFDKIGESEYIFRERNSYRGPRNPTASLKTKIEKEAPSITNINISEKTKTSFFGKAEVEIIAQDNISGIRDIEYQLKSLSDPIDPNGWISYDPNNKPVIDPLFIGEVVARATDNAGNLSAEFSSTDIQVGILSISAPVKLFFSAYDTGSGPVFSSPEYQIVNKSNWGVSISIERIQKKSNNSIILTNNTPTKEDQLKLTLSPKSGFQNKSDILIEDGMTNRKLGEIPTSPSSSTGIFTLEAVLSPQLSSNKYYNFDYDFVFKFSPI